MEVINDLLNYNNLKIVQNTDWFNFSLDSVLLSDFIKVKDDMKIIDFCTGNCPIPLILSTKIKTEIYAVELQKEVYDLGKKSIKINNLDNQIKLLNKDVKDLSNIFETDTFDLITCNPPYFKIEEFSKLNDNSIKTIARHEKMIDLENIFKIAKKILKNNGKIAMVHRTDRLIDIIMEMKKNNIEPKRICYIYPKENTKSNMVLIEGAKNGKPGLIVEKPIIVHNENGDYKEEILKIFNEV